MDFLQRHLPRVYQAVQDALDYLSNVAAQVFGAPANVPRPSNSGSKVAIGTETPGDPNASKVPALASWGAGSSDTEGSGTLRLEDALEATELSVGEVEPPPAARHEDMCRHPPGVTAQQHEEPDLRSRKGSARTRRDLEYQIHGQAEEALREALFQSSHPGGLENPALKCKDVAAGDLEHKHTGDKDILKDEAGDPEGRDLICIHRTSTQIEPMMVKDIGLLKDEIKDSENPGHVGLDGMAGDVEAESAEDTEVLLVELEKNKEQAGWFEDETRFAMEHTDTQDPETFVDKQKDLEDPAYGHKDGLGVDLPETGAGDIVSPVDTAEDFKNTAHSYIEGDEEDDRLQIDTQCAENPYYHSEDAGISVSSRQEGTMGEEDQPSVEVTEILLLEGLETTTETCSGGSDADQTKREEIVDNSTPPIQDKEEGSVFKGGEESSFCEEHSPTLYEESMPSVDIRTVDKGEMDSVDRENKVKNAGEFVEDLTGTESLENRNYVESNLKGFANNISPPMDNSQSHLRSMNVDLESCQVGSNEARIPSEGPEEGFPVICVSDEDQVHLMDEEIKHDIFHLEERKSQSETTTCSILDLGEMLETLNARMKSDSSSGTLGVSYAEEIEPTEQVEDNDKISNIDVPGPTAVEAETVVSDVTLTNQSVLEETSEIKPTPSSDKSLPTSPFYQPHNIASLQSEGHPTTDNGEDLLVEVVESENKTFVDDKTELTSGVSFGEDKCDDYVEEKSGPNYEAEDVMNSVSCNPFHLEEPEYSLLQPDQTTSEMEEVQQEDHNVVYRSEDVPFGDDQLVEQPENHLRDFERTVWYEECEESPGECHTGVLCELVGEERSDSNARPKGEPPGYSTKSDEMLVEDTLNGLETMRLQTTSNVHNVESSDTIDVRYIQEVHHEYLHEYSSLGEAQYPALEGSQTYTAEKDTDYFLTDLHHQHQAADEGTESPEGKNSLLEESHLESDLFPQIQSEISEYVIDEHSQQGTEESCSLAEGEVKRPTEPSQTQDDDGREVSLIVENVDTLLNEEPLPLGLSIKDDSSSGGQSLSLEVESIIDPDLNVEGMCETHEELDLLSEIQTLITPWHPEPTSSKFTESNQIKEIQSTTMSGQLDTEMEQTSEMHNAEWLPELPTEDLGPSDHTTEDIKSSDLLTADMETPYYSTEHNQPCNHPIGDSELPEHLAEGIESSEHPIQDIESFYHTTKDIESADYPKEDIESRHHPTDHMASPDHHKEDMESPSHPKEDMASPGHHKENIETPDHPTEDIEPPDHHKEDIGSSPYSAEDIESPDHPTEDLEPPEHSSEGTGSPKRLIEDLKSSEHSTQNSRQPDQPTEGTGSPEHSAEDIGSSDLLTEDLKASEHSTQDCMPPEHHKEDIESPGHPTKDIGALGHSAEDFESPDHLTEDCGPPDHPIEDLEAPDHPSEDLRSPEHSAEDIGALNHLTEVIEAPEHHKEDIELPDHPIADSKSPQHSREDYRSEDYPTEDNFISILTESTTQASSDDHGNLSDAPELRDNICTMPGIDIVISFDDGGADHSESLNEPEPCQAQDVIRERSEQENSEKSPSEAQITCPTPDKNAEELRDTWGKEEDKLQSTSWPSDGDNRKNMEELREGHLSSAEHPFQNVVIEELKQTEGEDEADADWAPHRTLDLSAQKSRVLLRRKTSIRRRQGLRQSLPEPPPIEPPVPAKRSFPIVLPGFGGKLPGSHPPAHTEPSHTEEQKEERPAQEELAIKPKKVLPKHAGFGIPHPQMMQELQSRLLKKKPKQ